MIGFEGSPAVEIGGGGIFGETLAISVQDFGLAGAEACKCQAEAVQVAPFSNLLST